MGNAEDFESVSRAKVADGRNFDVYLKPEQPVTLQNLKDIMRNHFEGYAHDPYSFGLNGSEPWRPISVFRTYEAHILQVRPWMPREIGDVIYVAFGMACLSCFMPFYQGLDQVPAAFGEGTDHADDKSIYWKFRKLQTLAMTDFPTLAPIVQKKFAEHEAAMSEKQSAMEKNTPACMQLISRQLMICFRNSIWKFSKRLKKSSMV